MEITNKLDLFDKLTAFVMATKNSDLTQYEKECLINYYCDLTYVDAAFFNSLPYMQIDNKIQLVKKLLADYDERVKR